MRYSPKLQTEGDPTVPPGTKEMKEFKFIQAKFVQKAARQNLHLSNHNHIQFLLSFAEDPCNFGCPICQSSRTAVWIVIDSQVFLLIHCNTKHDQCIIVSELKNKQVLRSTFLGLRKQFKITTCCRFLTSALQIVHSSFPSQQPAPQPAKVNRNVFPTLSPFPVVSHSFKHGNLTTVTVSSPRSCSWTWNSLKVLELCKSWFCTYTAVPSCPKLPSNLSKCPTLPAVYVCKSSSHRA